MEVEDITRTYFYSDTELDRVEGEAIEGLQAHCQQPIPDPDRWLAQEIQRNVLVTTVDGRLTGHGAPHSGR